VSLDPVGAPVADGGAMPIMAYTRMGREPGRIRPGERAFTFTWYAGPLAAAGYHVVMRKIGPRWYVRSFVPTWVS
jgi:hypothetical protein